MRAAWDVVQMGAPVGQGMERKEGWAWVDTQPGQDTEILEAYRLADLVSNTLRLEVRPDADPPGNAEGIVAGVCHRLLSR